MSSSRRNQGAWSKWEHDEQNNRYFRARRNHRGDWEYDYSYPPGSEQQAPRGDGVDNLASSMSNVTISDTSYNLDTPGVQDGSAYDDSYTFSAPTGSTSFGLSGIPPSPGQNIVYSDQTQGYGAPPAQGYDGYSTRPNGKSYDQSSGYRPSKGKSSSSRRPRNRGKPQPDDLPPAQPQSFGPGEPFYEPTKPTSSYDEASSVASEYGTDLADGTDASVASEFDDQGTQVAPNPAESSYYSGSTVTLDPRAAVFSEPGPIEGEVEEDTATVIQPPEEYSTIPEAYEEDDGYGTGMVPGPSSMVTGYDQSAYQFQDDPGQQTPRALSPMVQTPYSYGNTINQRVSDRGYGTSHSSQQNDIWSSFVVEHSSRFQPGEVFKIYWSEPLGSGMNATLRSYMQRGQKFHESFRRFIVVATDEGHSTCVPILTYGHQACTKKGVKPRKHGIVYASGTRPRMMPGEPDLGFEPVRLELTERTEKLDKESRVNYAKLVTIEHNYRVFFIGRIATSDFHNIVTPAVDYCWQNKNR